MNVLLNVSHLFNINTFGENMDKNNTLITFVLDESGSMEDVREQTIIGINSYPKKFRIRKKNLENIRMGSKMSKRAMHGSKNENKVDIVV